MTRRVVKEGYHKYTDNSGRLTIHDVISGGCRTLWSVGELIGLKRSRTGKVEARVLCTGLRIERVQDITEEDARKEGVDRSVKTNHCMAIRPTARAAFEATWRRLYPRGPKAWNKNPMVVVIEFKLSEVVE